MESALVAASLSTALVVLVQSIELFSVRQETDQVFAAALVRAHQARVGGGLGRLLGWVAAPDVYRAVLVLRMVVALAWAASVLGGVAAGSVFACVLLGLHLSVASRFLGTFNGGSDAMTSVLLIGLTIAGLPDARAPLVGLGFIAAQLTLSYFVAGLAKLTHRSWRCGEALGSFVRLRRYGVPPSLVTLLDRPRVALLAAWIVMLFECSFPIVWLDARAALPFLAAAFLFHLANWVAFGLNRFVYTWAAAYPALLAITSVTGA